MAIDLRALRTKRGLDLAEAAKFTGISQTILRMLEDGPLKPTAHELRLITQSYAAAETQGARPKVLPSPKAANLPPARTKTLRKARDKLGLTWHQAASKLGMTVAMLRHLEDGIIAPTREQLDALQRLYGVQLTSPLQGELFSADGE